MVIFTKRLFGLCLRFLNPANMNFIHKLILLDVFTPGPAEVFIFFNHLPGRLRVFCLNGFLVCNLSGFNPGNGEFFHVLFFLFPTIMTFRNFFQFLIRFTFTARIAYAESIKTLLTGFFATGGARPGLISM
jgi:hypothetical protein